MGMAFSGILKNVVLKKLRQKIIKKVGGILLFKLMDKHSNQTGQNLLSQNLFGTNINIFTKLCQP